MTITDKLANEYLLNDLKRRTCLVVYPNYPIESIADRTLFLPRQRQDRIIDNVVPQQASTATILLKKTMNVRLLFICLAAASVGLSMVIISLAKFLLLLCALTTLLFGENDSARTKRLRALYTPFAVLFVLSAFALSLLWTTAPPADALGSVAKYGKLLFIVLMVCLIRDRFEAMYALGAFILAQTFLLISSWLLFVHVPVPWASSNMALTQYSVFSSYLDQSIISAVVAAICWHLRALAPGRYGKHFAVAATIGSLGMVLFVMNGRSGHAVAIALLSIAIMWELPRKYRLAVLVLPLLIASILFVTSAKVRERLTMVTTEVQSYSTTVEPTTSSGVRLGLWRRALQSIAQHPLAGSGVGSWSTEYNRLRREKNPAQQDIAGNGNPHQEYLLWGVQLGIPGVFLFVALTYAVFRDSLKMQVPFARATQSALLAFAVACLFNASLYDAQIGDFFCILIGLLLALGFHETGVRASPAAPTGQKT